MNYNRIIAFILLGFSIFTNDLYAIAGPESKVKLPASDQVSWRAACVRPTRQYDMQINNVRARVLTGGDVWSEAAYIVPKPAPGQLPVSAIYAGGVWIGGVDRTGGIKLSAVTYRGVGFDFFSGPLDQSGASELKQCQDWDRFFTVKGDDVRKVYELARVSKETGVPIDCDEIPEDVRYWPGQGNPYWREKYNFALPNQTLGSFWDEDGDGVYDPCNGDFPTIEIRDCEPSNVVNAVELIPDEMVYWIYNDNGGPQTASGPRSIQMEVQVQAFAYATNDEINDMTFYRYKLINKSSEDLIDCYFSMWVDPDLGCYSDDYIGCDVDRSMAYVYNEDAVDGSNGSACDGGVVTYGDNVPILGIDYFRGPRGPKVIRKNPETGERILDANGGLILDEPIPNTGGGDTLVELGMTSFIYYENPGVGTYPPPTTDPQRGREDAFYNYIRGLWADGTPLTRGGSGYNPGSTDTVRYAVPDVPNLIGDDVWSMCSPRFPFGDRRTLQATGPLLLVPGATNELIVGVVFVPDMDYPCPDIKRLQNADDIAQALFDNCFDITDGPDAPDLTAVELDRELILMLSNEPSSNNFGEVYRELDLQAPPGNNAFYLFEGYKIYQLVNASVTGQELSDITKAREIFQVDLKNNIKTIYNWTGTPNPLNPSNTDFTIWTPTREVSGADAGIRTSFRVIRDQFAREDRRLVNHKQYHFLTIAYAHNDWQTFNSQSGVGQKRAYLAGRGNIGGVDNRAYTLVPRPIVYEELNSAYGEGPLVTRISGEGNPNIFLDMDSTMYNKILQPGFDGKIVYKSGFGPIDAKVVDPIRVKDGKFRLEVTGAFNSGRGTCAYGPGATWTLFDQDNVALLQDRPLSFIREFIINKFGISLTVNNQDEPGNGVSNNGAIGARLDYKNPNGQLWYNAIKDGGIYNPSEPGVFSLDFVRNGFLQDPDALLSKMGDGFFVPFLSTKFEIDINVPFYLSPAARDFQAFMNNTNYSSIRYRDLNNVDIVFTSDKSKWSKCMVVETGTSDYTNNGFATIGNARNFELRQSPSVGLDGQSLNDGTVGFGYFPGYAVDVETGKRLNIFFGENSVYSGENAAFLDGNNPIGGDMIFNPSSQTVIEDQVFRDPRTGQILGIRGPLALVAGGQHYIYVTRQAYDECKLLSARLVKGAVTANKARVGGAITWTSFPMEVASAPFTTIDKGLIPNDLTVKLRVNNPYGPSRVYNTDKDRDCESRGDKPVYEFEFRGKESKQLTTSDEYVGALANVNVVPNPYYAYSAYETSQFTSVIKITNLPARATVSIYTLDGTFVRQYQRDETGRRLGTPNAPITTGQVFPDLDWDMRNFREVPVASGVYLIHISAPDYGEERTLKWFGIGRKFDPSGL